MQDQATAAAMAEARPEGADAIGELRAQGAIYRLLARFLEQEVDGPLLQLLRNGLREPLAEAGVLLEGPLLEDPEGPVLEALAEEYTGLFVAPGGVSPYLSVFETGCLYREPCDRVMAAYQAAGWDYQRHYSGEFPDHIGTMLGFVGLLYGVQADALEAGDSQRAEQAASRRETFLKELLAPWAPGWCRRAAEAALQPLYQQVLTLTGRLLWLEINRLVDRRQLRELQKANLREPRRLDYDADFRKASGI